MAGLFVPVKKFLILCHRWTGTAFCVLFCWWFISGIFMMYVDFPEVTPADRLRRAQPIDASRINLNPQQAWLNLNTKGEPDEVRLAMFDGRPAYRFRLGKARAWVYADNGAPQLKFPPELNLRTAAAWAGEPAARAEAKLMTQEDQWTVGGVYYQYEPIIKYSWTNGKQVYISTATGEVVQYTTSWQRIFSYIGPVAHWLYFTPVRKNGRIWSRIVIWLSSAATAVALLGLFAGLSIYRPSKGVPYRGTKRLHMIFGLCFGLIACTWAFSGMLSMDPFPVNSAGVDSRIPNALEGEPFDFASFALKSPKNAMNEIASVHAKQIEFLSVAGRSFYLATEDPKHSVLVPVNGQPVPEFDHAWLLDVVSKAVISKAVVTEAGASAHIAESGFINDYDSYYLDRHHQLPLPVLYVRLNDLQNSRFYIDPRTARVVGAYSSGQWIERWLYHGLHSVNFLWLYTHRPAWDVTVLLLMLGGTALSLTSAVIGWRFLWLRTARKYTR